MKGKGLMIIGIIFLVIILSPTIFNLIEYAFLPTSSLDLNEEVIKPIKKKSGDVTISFDPRLELLASIEMNSKFYNIIKYDTKYKKEMKRYFRRVRDHEVIDMFKEIGKDGLYVDIPPSFMLYLTEVPNLEVRTKIDDNVISKFTKDEESTEKFLEELRDYAIKSDIQNFFKNHREVYSEKIQDVKDIMDKRDYVKDIEEYYGLKQKSYNIILSPLFEGNFGPRISREDGTMDLYAIIGGSDFRGKIDEESLRYLVWHEFSHSFINPTTEKYKNDLKKYEDNFNGIKDKMRKIGYGKWEITVNEHIIRAVTIRLTNKVYGKEEADKLLEKERNRGFVYIDDLIEKLDYYESNRDKYKNIKEFYPKLISVFKKSTR